MEGNSRASVGQAARHSAALHALPTSACYPRTRQRSRRQKMSRSRTQVASHRCIAPQSTKWRFAVPGMRGPAEPRKRASCSEACRASGNARRPPSRASVRLAARRVLVQVPRGSRRTVRAYVLQRGVLALHGMPRLPPSRASVRLAAKRVLASRNARPAEPCKRRASRRGVCASRNARLPPSRAKSVPPCGEACLASRNARRPPSRASVRLATRRVALHGMRGSRRAAQACALRRGVSRFTECEAPAEPCKRTSRSEARSPSGSARAPAEPRKRTPCGEAYRVSKRWLPPSRSSVRRTPAQCPGIEQSHSRASIAQRNRSEMTARPARSQEAPSQRQRREARRGTRASWVSTITPPRRYRPSPGQG